MRTIYKRSDDSKRVVRGGSWINLAQGCRSADRDSSSPDYRYNLIGFRPSKNVKEKK